jgi:hypothetical protein
MRISIDPNDPAYVDDRPRKVRVNDREVQDWAVADEFRRCVVLMDGQVLHGAVGIERLVGDHGGPKAQDTVEASLDPIATGFVGVLVAEPAPAPMPARTPAPTAPPKRHHKNRRR